MSRNRKMWCVTQIKIIRVINYEIQKKLYCIYDKTFYLEADSSYFRDSEPSALEGLVRGFISSPLSFLIRLSSVDWPSWRSERHGRCFQRFPLWKDFCLSHFCFNS